MEKIMTISVVPDHNIYVGLVNLPVVDVDFFMYDRALDGVRFYTDHGVYFAPGSSKYWLTNLRNSGYKFEDVFRNTALHIPNVTGFDDEYHRARFAYNAPGYFCQIADSKFPVIKLHVMISKSS